MAVIPLSGLSHIVTRGRCELSVKNILKRASIHLGHLRKPPSAGDNPQTIEESVAVVPAAPRVAKWEREAPDPLSRVLDG